MMKIIGGFFTWTPDGIPTLSNITIRIPRGMTQFTPPYVPPPHHVPNREEKQNQYLLSTCPLLPSWAL